MGNMVITNIIFFSLLASPLYCGITIPQDECRWMVATDFGTELKCDGNEVAVGACSGGRNRDCPGNSVHQLKCCAVPDYYYSGCNTFGAKYGVNQDCRDHGKDLLQEGSCSSGHNADCHGDYNIAECCSGHLCGRDVGPTAQCTWENTGHGIPLECGRDDEVLVGRCGSGGREDCQGNTSHGILCCELDYLS